VGFFKTAVWPLLAWVGTITVGGATLPKPISLEEAARAFEPTAPKYQGRQGLVRKYYLRSEDGRRAGG
jgi:hypothetical protein